MPFKVRLFPRDREEPIVQVGPFYSATPQVGDPIEVPVGKPTVVKAMVVGVYRTHHAEEIDVVDAYEDPPTRLVC